LPFAVGVLMLVDMTTDLVTELLRAKPSEALARLNAVTPEVLLAPQAVVSHDDAMLVKAALYLKHGALEACHKIAQQVETPNGSYWHALMHRQEGDFGNSKYWYRRVGVDHPVRAKMGDGWDPYAFVDRCASEPGAASSEEAQREFSLLLVHTIGRATGVAR
jgi:hypothetical protein